MSKPIYTPLPYSVALAMDREFEGHEIRYQGRCVAVTTTQDAIEVDAEEQRLAQFLAAACNAFDSAARILGLNAIELAERMADGGIAELAEALLEYVQRQEAEGDCAGLPEYEKANAAIAKVRRRAE